MDGYLSKPIAPSDLYAEVEATVDLDARMLAERFGGDAQVLREVVEVFLRDYPGQYARVLHAMECADGAELERAAPSAARIW